MQAVWGVLRFLRSLSVGAVAALPVALAVVAYTHRDYLNRDGLLLILSEILNEAPAAGSAPPPEDWGHDAIPPPDPALLAIAPMLRAGDHAGLDALGTESPGLLARFQDTSPDLAGPLDAWVAARPDSAGARLLRGRYWYGVGWHERGHAYAGGTTETQFARMRRAFARARADLEAAVAMAPASPHAYPLLVRLLNAAGGGDADRAVWRQAVEAGAASNALHLAYFNSLTPWWNGRSGEASAAEIQAVLDRLAAGEPAGDVDLALLRPFPDYVEAEFLLRTGRYEEGLARYESFVDEADARLFLRHYARRLVQGGRPADALKPFAEALRHAPSDADVLRDYGDALSQLGLHREAAEALDRALALDPYDPRARLLRARLDVARGRVEAALADIDRAEVYGAERESVLRGAGRIRVRLVEDLNAAVAEYRAAVDAKPGRAENHYFLAALLDRMRDCGAIPAYRGYVEMCRAGADCIPGTVNRSAVRWQSLVDRYICSIDGHRLEPEPAWVAMPLE